MTAAAVPLSFAITAAVKDSVMGGLSPIARMIAAGLRDSVARYELNAQLKAQLDRGAGIDVVACNAGMIDRLLRTAEREGVGSARSACGQIQRSRGMVLYMDPSRLRAWSPTVAPVVTAVAAPDAGLPEHFLGYLGSRRAIQLSRDPKLRGPVLVLIAQPHPDRLRGRAAEHMRTVEIVQPDRKEEHLPRTGMPSIVRVPSGRDSIR